MVEYLAMVDAFVANRISAVEFETTFLRTYKSDPSLWNESAFRFLQNLFFLADEYFAEGSPAERNRAEQALRDQVRELRLRFPPGDVASV